MNHRTALCVINILHIILIKKLIHYIDKRKLCLINYNVLYNNKIIDNFSIFS